MAYWWWILIAIVGTILILGIGGLYIFGKTWSEIIKKMF
jgi:uncharacterized protein YneF (UPF0154 family)